MPQLRAKKFEAFADAVADAVSWQQGTGSEWECDCIISAETLGDLVRLAFEAPAAERKAFLDALSAA